MTIQDIGILTTLVLTIIGWGVTFYYQRKLLEQQIKADREKIFLEYNQKLRELEKESFLNIKEDSIHQINERRLSIYPKIAELIYRTRNLAREICHITEPNQILFNEFYARALDLEEIVYTSKFDLERDNIFDLIHSYKNKIYLFSGLSKDLIHLINNIEEAGKVFDQIKKTYSEIENEYNTVIINITKITT
jgi:hypothetical protein